MKADPDQITGKLICINRGEAPDQSDRHLVMVVGVLAIPKTSEVSKEIKKSEVFGTIAMVDGFNGGITLSQIEDLPHEFRGRDVASLVTLYDKWQI
jgi:hypothetical protein